MIRLTTSVIRQSDLFAPGVPQRVMKDTMRKINLAVARDTHQLVVQHLDRVMRAPTGEYLSRVAVKPEGDGYVVHDGGSVKGPWLEGVGSRNFPVTRFKGYAAFRRTKQLMLKRSVQIAERILEREIRRLQ